MDSGQASERCGRGAEWGKYQDHVMVNKRLSVRNMVTFRTRSKYKLQEGQKAAEVKKGN